MKTIQLGKSELQVPVIAVGCMRIQKLNQTEAEKFIKTALELGANFFDHADVYGDGACEALFAKAIGMTPILREQMILQLSLIHISEPTRLLSTSYAVFCLKQKKHKTH